MDGQGQSLEKSKSSSLLKKPFNTLELIVLLFVVSLIALAFIDSAFHSDLKEIATIVISGYLGNKVPK